MGRVIHTEIYESLTEMIDAALKPAAVGVRRSSRVVCDTETDTKTKKRYGTTKWYGTPNFEAAVQLAQEGWSGPRKQVQSTVTEVMDALGSDDSWSTVGPQMTYDLTGGAPDVGLFMAGEPECMVNFIMASECPSVRIMASASYLARVEVEYVLARGAVISALVEALHAAGVSVELWGSLSSKNEHGEIADMFVRVKSYGDPLDMDQVMFVFAHPSFARRIGFAAKETLPRDVVWSQHYGLNGRSYSNSCLPGDLSPIGEFDLVIGPNQGHDDPIVRDPIGWVRDTIKQLKGEAG